jgi:anti-sigma regulatory factor (Ser/Thr protein kinase)
VELNARLPSTLRAPFQARRLLDRLEPELRPPLLDDVRLLVNELVTNSVRHAGLGVHDYVRVAVRTAPGIVRAEVGDEGMGFEPAARGARRPHQWSGWGLLLVERLSDRWGVKREEGLREVWFEIDR